MGDDILYERDFPCPCGHGHIHVEIYEHDTWPSSGRHKRWSLECADCEAKYKRRDGFLMLAQDADELDRRSGDLYKRRTAVGEVTAQRYLARFREHVKNLRFKTAMQPALDVHGGIATFRRDTSTPERLDNVIEQSLRFNPVNALEQLKVRDAEITDELARIKDEEKALKEYEANLERFAVPAVDF